MNGLIKGTFTLKDFESLKLGGWEIEEWGEDSFTVKLGEEVEILIKGNYVKVEWVHHRPDHDHDNNSDVSFVFPKMVDDSHPVVVRVKQEGYAPELFVGEAGNEYRKIDCWDDGEKTTWQEVRKLERETKKK